MDSAGHGSYQIFSEDGFIYARLYDSWNTVTAQNYSQQLTHLVKQFNQQQWAAIFDFRHWQLMTPESIPIVQQQINWSLQHKLSHCIYLVKPEFNCEVRHSPISSSQCHFFKYNRWLLEV